MSQTLTKSRAVFEVVLVFLLTMIVMWILQYSPVAEWQNNFLHHYFHGHTVMILISLLAIFVTRKSFGTYAITFRNMRYHLNIASSCLAVVMPLSALGFAFLLPKLQTSYVDWDGALILSVLGICQVFLIAYLLKKKQTFSNLPSSNIILFLFLLVAAFSLAIFTTPYTKRISGFVFYLFFVGFGEEILYRGYIQSRLNEAFDRSYHFFGVNWGWGIIIASLIFGFSHMGILTLSLGEYVLRLPWVFWTFFSGLVFGFIREKTGSIVAPAVVHGMPQAFAILFFGWE